MTNAKIAIIGWHEGLAGQLHAFLVHAGTDVDCFVCETGQMPVVKPVPRRAKLFSYPEAGCFKGLPLIAVHDWVDVLVQRGVGAVYIAVVDPLWRYRTLQAVRGQMEVLSYVHPSAVILPEARLGTGCILLAGAILGYRAEMGDGAILNTGAQVDHHCVLEDCTTLQPSATLCGNVCVGKMATVGAGATVVQRVTIGEGAVVGAGALVRHHVEAYTQVVGVPARFLRKMDMACVL